MVRLIAKTKSISKIRFGIEYSLEVRKHARPKKRFLAHPNDARFDETLLRNFAYRNNSITRRPAVRHR